MHPFVVIFFVVSMHAASLAQYCNSHSDCALRCVNNHCDYTFKLSRYCSKNSDCGSDERCRNSRCIECDVCMDGERCDDEGKCVNDSVPTSSIIGLVAVVVIASFIACVVYCRRARCGRPTPSQSHQQQVVSTPTTIPIVAEIYGQSQSVRNTANIVVVPNIAQANREAQQAAETTHHVSFQNVAETDRQVDDQSNDAVHPGGPPDYDSLQKLNRAEEARHSSYQAEELQPPPSYEEAMNNSHNNLKETTAI